MAVLQEDYNIDDVVQFLKEEFERIIAQYPFEREGSVLSDAQAFEIWFLHQELGMDYQDAVKRILDGPHDCGVDFIVTDDSNRQVLVGQAEYDTHWDGSPADENKAVTSFEKFRKYLAEAKMPDDLPDYAKERWREANQRASSGYTLRYVFASPHTLTASQEERIRVKSGLPNYGFVSHDLLIQRGEEFLDGQTGMCNFDLGYQDLMKVPNAFGNVYYANGGVKEIDRIVTLHKERKRLRALFASNVRTFLSAKKRSKDIADAMKTTLKSSPHEFLVCNNGITIQCSKVTPKYSTLQLERASISNGCQSAMNIHAFFQENQGSNPDAQVLVTVVELIRDASRLASDIARSRNNQNPVDNRDLMSNNFRLVSLHHRLLADRIAGSERRYYLLRKSGEKQTFLKEQPEARGQFLWIDAGELAQCIAAVIRQDPYMSQRGANDIFGGLFNKIFPAISDPSHSRCKYAWWLYQAIYYSYGTKTKWKGMNDEQIFYEKDFKNPAIWIAAALIAARLKEDFRFGEPFEQRFVTKCEQWWFKSRSPASQEFMGLVEEVVDDAYRLVYSISRTLLGTKLPKGRDVYSTYDALLKAPSVYDVILSRTRRGQSKTYQDRLYGSMRRFNEYLKTS